MLLLALFAFGCGDDDDDDAAAGPSVTGTVIDPEGSTVRDATILIVDAANKQVGIGQSDRSGKFSIEVSDGTYTAFARGEFRIGTTTTPLEGMSEQFTMAAGSSPKVTIQMRQLVEVNTICLLSDADIQAHADKNGLLAFFSAQKFNELGVKEGQLVFIEDRFRDERSIVVSAFQSDSILCELLVPAEVGRKLTTQTPPAPDSPQSISNIRVFIAVQQLFQ